MNELQEKLLKAAIRAPSGDNCQPWRFKLIDEKTIDLYIDEGESQSFFDLNFRATYISIGAVIENIRVAAAHSGHAIDYEFLSEIASNTPVIRISIDFQSKIDRISESNYQAMLHRTVNRRPFSPFKLPGSKWLELLDVATPREVSVISYSSMREKKSWARIVKNADLIRWQESEIHQELFDKIRYSADEATATQNGLEIDRLGAGPLAPFIMRFLSNWDRLKRLNRYGIARLLANQTASLVNASAGLVGVWVDNDTPQSWIKGGEVTQSLWNNAHALGLAVQPLPVSLYLSRRYELEGMAHFSQEHDDLLKEISQDLLAIQNKNLENKVGVMLFRVGKSVPMKSVSIRKSLDYFLIS